MNPFWKQRPRLTRSQIVDGAPACLLHRGASLSTTTKVSPHRRGAAAGGCFLISDKCHCCRYIFAECHNVSAEGRNISDVCSSCMRKTTLETNLDSQWGHRMTNQAHELKPSIGFKMSQMVLFILLVLLLFGFVCSCKLGAEKHGQQGFYSHAACERQSWRRQTKETRNDLLNSKINRVKKFKPGSAAGGE